MLCYIHVHVQYYYVSRAYCYELLIFYQTTVEEPTPALSPESSTNVIGIVVAVVFVVVVVVITTIIIVNIAVLSVMIYRLKHNGKNV